MEHHFNIEIAKVCGVDCAIMYNNLYYWIKKNEANNKHFYDGKFWTYNSAGAFKELFPYWSERQIRRILSKLEEMGYIESGNYNKSGYDRTRWYCLKRQMHVTETSDACYQTVSSMLPNGQMEVTKTSNGSDQTVTPIPNNKPNKKQNIKIEDRKPQPDNWKNWTKQKFIEEALKTNKQIDKKTNQPKDLLSDNELNKFIGYWADQTFPDGRLKFQGEKTWGMLLRMFTWKQNQNKFN